MKNVIVRYGIIAGLIVGIWMLVYMLTLPADTGKPPGMLLTYAVQLVALTMVFVGIKQYRDHTLGGVIKFGPAMLVGLGISAVAGLFYVIAWELCEVFMKFDYVNFYEQSMVEAARARGGGPAELEKAATQAADFTRMYSNPLFRVPMVFLEIFPVGILVSLISAALLRNSRVLPARAPAP